MSAWERPVKVSRGWRKPYEREEFFRERKKSILERIGCGLIGRGRTARVVPCRDELGHVGADGRREDTSTSSSYAPLSAPAGCHSQSEGDFASFCSRRNRVPRLHLFSCLARTISLSNTSRRFTKASYKPHFFFT